MAWARFDDKRHMNPKLLAAGLEANGLDANGITYCAANETDGFIPDAALPLLAVGARAPVKKLAGRLVDVGRWERDDERKGHWVHDYLNYNDSKEKAEEKRQTEREKKARQRLKGASAVGRNDQGRFVSPGDSNGTHTGSPKGTHRGSPTGSPLGSPPLPDPTRPTTSPSRSEERVLEPDVPAGAGGDGETWGAEGWTPSERAKAEALVDRVLEVVKPAKGRPSVRDARRLVTWAAGHLDWGLVDEAVGYCGALSDTPRSVAYLGTTIRSWGAQRGVELPEYWGNGRRTNGGQP